MKRLAILALSACALAPAMAQTSIGLSIGINEPGVYGRIDIGNYPQPRFINAQPVLVVPPARYVQQEPIYLYVPPEHQRDWAHHCGYYHACGQPVYFVHEDWIRERYEAQHHHVEHDRGRDEHERAREEHAREKEHDHGRGHDERDHDERDHGDRDHR